MRARAPCATLRHRIHDRWRDKRQSGHPRHIAFRETLPPCSLRQGWNSSALFNVIRKPHGDFGFKVDYVKGANPRFEETRWRRRSNKKMKVETP
jgi:hypothetical protein